jgi:hypothetical protein
MVAGPMLRLLPLLLLSFLVAAAPASAAPRCAKSTITIGAKAKPRACLPKTLPAAGPAVLKPLVKGKPNRRLEKLAQREFRARAARADLPAGVKLRVSGGVVELRDKAGASYTMGLVRANRVPRCPRADGAVPATLDETTTFGYGQKSWTLVTVRNEATWTGHVGVGAKAETFDVAFRGELTIKSGTGKKHHPTRTFRSALTKRGVPVTFDPVALAREMTLRGPKDLKAATALLTTSMLGLMEIRTALEQGDRRWYDERACAQLDFSATPEKVVKGGRADWNAWVNAEDGTRAADARWTLSSACGALNATTLSGATVAFGVADAAGAWGPPSAGACATGEITSTAGRPRAFNHSIPPLEPQRYRYDILITFREDMGPDVAATDANGLGRVTVGPGEGWVDGEGTFLGTEWDSGVGNTCGQDMLRSRAFSSPAVVGAEIEGDRVTIAFTAVLRPLSASWVVTVPVTGGSEFFASYHPFCGEPDRALRHARIEVKATPVS